MFERGTNPLPRFGQDGRWSNYFHQMRQDTIGFSYHPADVRAIGILTKSFTGQYKAGQTAQLHHLWNFDALQLGGDHRRPSSWPDGHEVLDQQGIQGLQCTQEEHQSDPRAD
jgi:hypothetical protein